MATPSVGVCRLNTTPISARGKFGPVPIIIYNQLHLINDFTHFLVDPVHGDQEDQFETRNVIGNGVS